MPVDDEIGYSETTPLKIEHLSRILSMHLAITQAVLNKNDYYRQQYRYVDLTAGRGGTPDGTPGSPLVFLDLVESGEFEKPYRVDLIEHNEDNLDELKEVCQTEAQARGWQLENTHFHLGEYETVVRDLFPSRNPYELGLVFVDPTGQVPDLETLQYVSEMRPRMDILIHVATTTIKRVYHITDMLLSDYMAQIVKTNWLIRKPLPWDSHKWTFLLGSNTDIFKSYKTIDFLRLDSKDAQQFFPKLNLSEKQRLAEIQPPLPGLEADE